MYIEINHWKPRNRKGSGRGDGSKGWYDEGYGDGYGDEYGDGYGDGLGYWIEQLKYLKYKI